MIEVGRPYESNWYVVGVAVDDPILLVSKGQPVFVVSYVNHCSWTSP